ncbi:DUF805 domain-containing protein [Jannaschia aquimarina]|uniref:YhaH protein n=1 Tax=Jannaschia aquimarina TaxID=935700 RepID=A0A0D1CMF9_9RHOB|nr:DUF805 domain-containing protein [Jannaschia aquimarina]KIT15967.1 Inner membrane protein YhaH [Jannaschia aquimarina]SNS98893.1 Uncharacterized membrane protein YhaH, DUF805 family [Jannaschia aquimarina]
MGFFEANLHCLKNPLTFEGRASRSEFWYCILGQTISFFVIFVAGFVFAIQGILNGGEAPAILSNRNLWVAASVVYLYVCAVQISVSVRRLHDTDHSGWWYWIMLVPFIGFIWYILLMAKPSDQGRNEYGSGPATAKRVAPKVAVRSRRGQLDLDDDFDWGEGVAIMAAAETQREEMRRARAADLRALRQSRMPS